MIWQPKSGLVSLCNGIGQKQFFFRESSEFVDFGWLDPVSKTNELICRRHDELSVQRSGNGKAGRDVRYRK